MKGFIEVHKLHYNTETEKKSTLLISVNHITNVHRSDNNAVEFGIISTEDNEFTVMESYEAIKALIEEAML